MALHLVVLAVEEYILNDLDPILEKMVAEVIVPVLTM